MKSEHHEVHALAASESDAGGTHTADAHTEGAHAEGTHAEADSIDRQLMELRSQISDLGYEVDLYKAGIGASMGGGLFLLLLGAGAGYDLVMGKAGIWSPLGFTNDLLLFIACGFGAAGIVLLIQGIIRLGRDRQREARLAELERQYSRLLDRKEIIPQEQS